MNGKIKQATVYEQIIESLIHSKVQIQSGTKQGTGL